MPRLPDRLLPDLGSPVARFMSLLPALAATGRMIPLPWGCPKCHSHESWVDDTGYDTDGYIIRNRRCDKCGTHWATEERPLAVGYWTRADSRNRRRSELQRAIPRTCRYCGGDYVYGFFSRHVRLSKRHAAAVGERARNGALRSTARKYARLWARKRAAA